MRKLPRLLIGDGVYIKGKDRLLGALLGGKPGMGKTTLLLNWIRKDLRFAIALILIDPSGDLARKVYKLARGKAIISSIENPIPLNVMQAPYDVNTIVHIIAEALNQVIKLTTPNEELTAKMRVILEEAVKECLAKERTSLVAVLDYILNMSGSDQTRDGIIARLMFLLGDDRLRKMLCGPNSVQIQEIINKGQKFILDCHGMSTDNMIFVGTILTHSIKTYFRHTRLEKYPPLALYIDEFHNFVNHNFFDILKEGRKYGIAAVLATQELATLGRELASVVLMCGNIVCFRVKYNEAFLIGREL